MYNSGLSKPRWILINSPIEPNVAALKSIIWQFFSFQQLDLLILKRQEISSSASLRSTVTKTHHLTLYAPSFTMPLLCRRQKNEVPLFTVPSLQ